MHIEDSIFLDNMATFSYGAIQLFDARVNAVNVTFGNNTSAQGSCFHVVQGSTLTLNQLHFFNNQGGTVIQCESGSSLNIHESSFTNHTSCAESLIDITRSNLKVSNSTFLANQMGKRGGIVHASKRVNAQVTQSYFESNTATIGTIFYILITLLYQLITATFN